MKEVVFVRRNIDKWRAANQLAKSTRKTSPDLIADTYLEVSADLAFARTHYPDSEIVPLLNNLSLQLHNHIYGFRPQRLRRILLFWWEEIPQEIYRHRRWMLASLTVFVMSVLLGIVSTLADPEFVQTVLGHSYVEMTLNNMRNGVPMGVYASDNAHNMMVEITLHNIGVSLYTYVSGIIGYFIPGMIQVSNGIMLGCFMTFFHQHLLLEECLLAVWLHGVFEITSIIVAGGAGMLLGSGWLFPGSLPRLTSFRLSAKASVKIIVGLIPFFVMAGFIESFITRHTEVPAVLRLAMILSSLALVLFYFVYLPYKNRHADF